MSSLDLPDLDALDCAVEDRRRVTSAAGTHNGIDHLEVVSEDQRTLEVHLLRPAPGEPGGVPSGPTWTVDNVRVTGGERITGIRVTALAVAGNVLSVTVDTAGDFSTYRLRLVASGTPDTPPSGVDPALAAVAFSFKAGCATRFDCVADPDCPPVTPLPAPPLDLLARDHVRLRQVLVDRLATTLELDDPASHPADPMTVVVDVLAHVAEQLAVTGDVVATEAHLHTARSRISLRRHARLLDHRVHDGTNARTWVAFEVDEGEPADGALLPRGTQLVTRGHGAAPALATLPPRRDGAAVFETLHDLRLAAGRSSIQFHTWSDEECCLPAGATGVTLVRTPGMDLAVGDVLVLEETVGRTTGLGADADRTRRHAVRLVEVHEHDDPVLVVDLVSVRWHAQDALSTPLCLAATIDPEIGVVPVAVARGNVVLADHGRQVASLQLSPATVDPARLRGRPYRPQVLADAVTIATPYDDDEARRRPAAAALAQHDGGPPVPALTLVEQDDDTASWTPVPDLLGADSAARVLVVEPERGVTAGTLGRSHVRFGDGRHGRRPRAGVTFVAHGRIGGGLDGNIGPESLGHVVTGLTGIRRVRNPIAATGGSRPATPAEIRRDAPEAYRTQQRAVTPEDYVRVAEEHPDVQRAAARVRWTGSWHTVFVTVDRRGGGSAQDDEEFRADLLARLEARRLAGADVELRDPVTVAVELALEVCVEPAVLRSDVEREIRRLLSARVRADGTTGLFHPDRFSFGDPLRLSPVLAAVQRLDGVTSVTATALHRFGRAPAGELGAGALTVADTEVVRLDDDPDAPEHGRLTLDVRGGR